MTDVEEITDEIRDIFCKYKEKQKCELFRTFSTVRCCECGHQSRIQTVQAKMCWYKKMTKFYHIVMMVMSLFMLFSIYFLWAARRYNRARYFGNGACVNTFFWTYDECIVSF